MQAKRKIDYAFLPFRQRKSLALAWSWFFYPLYGWTGKQRTLCGQRLNDKILFRVNKKQVWIARVNIKRRLCRSAAEKKFLTAWHKNVLNTPNAGNK
jgi:hypothetical protein